MKFTPIAMLHLLLAFGATAQPFSGEVPEVKDNGLREGSSYDKRVGIERSIVPYPSIREADVMYAHRIERIMDIQEKQNLPCRWPQNALVDIIFDAVSRRSLTAYRSDRLAESYRADTVLPMFGTREVIQIEDRRFPGEFIDSVIITPYPLEEVVRWKIIENWIWDKQSGQFKPRITAIAPVMKLKAEGIELGEYDGFYIDWKEARSLMIHEEFFNRHNDANRYSYYDFFEQRHFSSYITKKPNVFDLPFEQYEELMDHPLAQLLEAKKTENERRNFESDLWQY